MNRRSDIIPDLIRGADTKRRMTIKPATGSLVGCKVAFTIKKKWSDTAIALQLTTDNGKIVILDAETVELTFSAADTAKLVGDVDYEYDVRVTDGAGKVWKKDRMPFPIRGSVS
jgi:hypothetical protein